MAISPIDVFRPQTLDGIQQILSSGTGVLVGALNNAVQIGRDHASLRANQERDYLAERERVEALDQRKAEFIVGQNNTDRAFAENVLRADREFEEGNRDDDRDYRFKVRTDSRDAALRAGEVASVQAARAADTELDKKKFDLDAEDTNTRKTYLRTRAADILNEAAPKTLIQRVLGIGPDPLPPVNQVQRGTELKSIGTALGDPDIAAKGDALIVQGTKGVAEERARIRATPRASTAKAPKTIEQEIADLEIKVQAAEEELASAESGESPDVTAATRLKLRENKLRLDALRKKAGNVTTPADKAPAVSAYDAYKSLIKKKS